MSAQFGKCNFGGKPVDPKEFEQVRALLGPYGPDREGFYSKDNIGILHWAFDTTKESRREVQPYVSSVGIVITWDGRLDNRAELIEKLPDQVSSDSTDLQIVAAAYARWEAVSFEKLIGDWTISVWNPKDRSLVLSKDFVGSRHLYYYIQNDQVIWCTILDPLVRFAGRSFELEGEYIAGWLSLLPAAHLTPYVGIHSVPPSCFVRLTKVKQTITKYWDFDPVMKIRYKTDQEYEEHFRRVFAESVRRRLRTDCTVTAELSGGMDSSSIVCVADRTVSSGLAELPRVDTISYYDDSEPNWNERPYFVLVEETRGRAGCHVDVSSQNWFELELEQGLFHATPASTARPNVAARGLAQYLATRNSRVLLSGIGGDEATGGLPTGVPHLADLLARSRLAALVHYLKIWALQERRPWLHLLVDVMRRFLPSSVAGASKDRRPAPWLNLDFVRRYQVPFGGYESRIRLLGALPSFQQNLITLDGLRRQLECSPLSSEPPREMRYPYLDRDFLRFMYAIPREQVIRPGQRRSLMRRALAGIVPDQILNRKRKAFVSRAPLIALSRSHRVKRTLQDTALSSYGVVHDDRLSTILKSMQGHQDFPIIALVRTLSLELWLRNARSLGLIASCPLLADRG